MKRNILAIAIMGFVLIIVLSMGMFAVYNNDKLSAAIEAEKNAKKEEISYTMTNSKGETIAVDLTKKKEDLGNLDTMRLIEKTEEYLYDFEFLEAHEFLSEEILQYNQDNLPENIRILRDETAIMSNFAAMLASKNSDLVVEAIKNLKNVDCFLVSALSLKQDDRRFLIESIKSINPVFLGNIKKINMKDITESYPSEGINELNEMGPLEKVYKHEFQIEGNTVWSYIAKVDGQLRFVKMVGAEANKTKYYTIEEWDLLFK